jgi:uncharacterized Zn-finger protein
MSQTFTEVVVLEKDTCGKCGGVYALNKTFLDYARNNAGGFRCPYCGTAWSWTETEAIRLNKALEAKNVELQTARMQTNTERQLREAAERREAEAKRKTRRVEKGVCPCCSRSFQNLSRHMATQHAKNPELREAAIQTEIKAAAKRKATR